MIWNCDNKVKTIEFEYNEWMKGYCCVIYHWYYAWETGWKNAGPWDWLKDGYTKKLEGWVEI